MKIKDLVIGRKYKIKSKEELEKLETLDHYDKHKAMEYAGQDMILNAIVNRSQLELITDWDFRTNKNIWLDIVTVEEVPGQPDPSKNILKAIKKLRAERFIYGYDGGPGGGRGGPIDTTKEYILLPAFDKLGNQGVYIPVDFCKRVFSLEKIDELFRKGETSQGFQATEYTYIRTDLSLIKDKNKLPEESSWSTMRD